MWQRHWNLTRNPFDERLPTFVATPNHLEAVARLVHTIESVGRSARLVAGAGLGKSLVVEKALGATRSPSRRVARVSGPFDAIELYSRLAEGLGGRVGPDVSRSSAWRVLANSARLCRWQGFHVVLVVDDVHLLEGKSDGLDLERLDHLDPDPSARLTILQVGRPKLDESSRHSSSNDWGLSIRLLPLTRSEVENYLTSKLESAGRSDPTFTPRAVSRIHALSEGVPQGLDRLATLALVAAAFRGLEMIPPEVVDEAARECLALEAIESCEIIPDIESRSRSDFSRA
jgi:MSHA biogenesis protein MshM